MTIITLDRSFPASLLAIHYPKEAQSLYVIPLHHAEIGVAIEIISPSVIVAARIAQRSNEV